MPPGENPSRRVQIHPASFRYDSSANSDTPKLRKPAGITAAVKPSSCLSCPLPYVSYPCHHSTARVFSSLFSLLYILFDLWPRLPRSYFAFSLFLCFFFFFFILETEAISRAHQTSRPRQPTSYFSFAASFAFVGCCSFHSDENSVTRRIRRNWKWNYSAILIHYSFETSYDVATNVLSFLYFKLAPRKYFFTENTRPLLEIYNKRTRHE